MNKRSIALDSIIIFGLFFFLLGFASFYVMFLGPNHGGFVSCSQAVGTSCYADPASGGIFTFLTIVGGPASALTAVHYRKVPMNLWEGTLLGFIVSLLFDLFILPTGFLPILPLNGSGTLIFIFFIICLGGIIGSGFKLVEKRWDKAPIEIRPSRQPSAPIRPRNLYAFVFLSGLLIASALYLGPSIVYGGFHSCFVTPGALTFKISTYSLLVGPPLFSEEQFLVTPGTTTYVTFIYTAYGNNDLPDWFSRYNFSSQPTSPWIVDFLTGQTNPTQVSQTGVMETFENISYQGTHVAMLLNRFDIAKSAGAATYMLAGVCEAGLLLTVGYVPYAGPMPFGEIQPAGLVYNVAQALAIATVISAFLHFYYYPRTKHRNQPQQD